MAAATVLGPNLAVADAYATALFAAGPAGLDWFPTADGYRALVATPALSATAGAPGATCPVGSARVGTDESGLRIGPHSLGNDRGDRPGRVRVARAIAMCDAAPVPPIGAAPPEDGSTPGKPE